MDETPNRTERISFALKVLRQTPLVDWIGLSGVLGPCVCVFSVRECLFVCLFTRTTARGGATGKSFTLSVRQNRKTTQLAS